MSDAAAGLVAVLVVLGALAGERFGPSPGGWSLVVAVMAVAAAASVVRGRGPRALLGLAAAGFLSAALMQRALDGLDGPMAEVAFRQPAVVATVRLSEDPRPGRWNARAMAEMESYRQECDGDPFCSLEHGHCAKSDSGHSGDAANPGRSPRCRFGLGSVIAVVAGGPAAPRLSLMSAGERVVLHGRLRPLAGVERRLRWRHAAAVLAADDLLGVAPPASPVMRTANRLRGLVLSGARRLPGTPAAVTAGLLVGDDRGLPGRVAAEFRAAGLSHLLAVSGANVALVLTLVGPALRRFGLAGRFAGGVAAIGLFAAMTRFEPSVLRASAMAGLSVLAAYLGRPASGRRLLALAVVGLVLLDPFLVHSLGFRLSVAASAGILFLARPLAARLPGPPPVAGALAVTAAAQVGVAPVALPAFGSLPLVAFPANLVAAPATAALTLWGFGSGLVGGLLESVTPAVPGALSFPTGLLATYLAQVAALAARFPVSVSPRAVVGLVAVSALALGAARVLRRVGPGPPSRPRAGRRERVDPGPSAPGRERRRQ